MQRETTAYPNGVVLLSLDNQHVNISCSCGPQAVIHSTPQSIQHSSPDARSMSETSSGFVSSTSSGTATDNCTAPPSSNSNSSESCACAQSGSAESLNMLIEAMRSRRSDCDSSSLQSLELAASANWSTSSSSTASKCRIGLQERYGEDLRRVNFAARVIQQAYRTHRLKRTFTKRCNEKRLSARISSSCFELDVTNDAFCYFGADREALCAQMRDATASGRQCAPQVLRVAQGDPTCKLADSAPNSNSGVMNQTMLGTGANLAVHEDSLDVNEIGLAFDQETDEEDEPGTDVVDEDDVDEELVQPCTMPRVETQPNIVHMPPALQLQLQVGPNANRPSCACCECTYGFERMQLAGPAPPKTNSGDLLVAYGTHAHAHHPQVHLHPHASPQNSAIALRRNVSANLHDNAGINLAPQQQLLVAPRTAPPAPAFPVQPPSNATSCNCPHCLANAHSHSHPHAHTHLESANYTTPQYTSNHVYTSPPYRIAFVHTNSHPASGRTASRCPHCAANQPHYATPVSNGNAQQLATRQLSAGAVHAHTHAHPPRSHMPSGHTSAHSHYENTPNLRATRNSHDAPRSGPVCACDHCRTVAIQNTRSGAEAAHQAHAESERLRKCAVKPKSTVSCVPFLLSTGEQPHARHTAATESPYEASPALRTRRGEMVSNALGINRRTPACACGSASCSTHTHPQPNAAELRHRRHYRVALNLFNRRPELGVRFLIDVGFVKSDDPGALASFLLRKRGFSRQVISEYLGSRPKAPQKQTGATSGTPADKQLAFVDRVLDYYANGIDMRHLEVLAALRKFQQYVRFCGEAQRIERFAQAFASAYCRQNARDVAASFRGGVDSVLLLAYAIVMLNTDLHNANVRADRKMKPDEFVRNLGGVDAGGDFDRSLLLAIYEQVRATPLQPATDHMAQVQKLENCIIAQRHAAKGKKSPPERRSELHLAVPERRLVCYCRLFKASLRRLAPGPHDKPDKDKDERDESDRQRDVFLLNDMLLVAKERKQRASDKKRDAKLTRRNSQPNSASTHTLGYFELCDAYPLIGMQVTPFESPPHCQFGIRVVAVCTDRARHGPACTEKQNAASAVIAFSGNGGSKESHGDASANERDGQNGGGAMRVTLLFYARSGHDRTQFLNDLQETILEATETEYMWNRYKMAAH